MRGVARKFAKAAASWGIVALITLAVMEAGFRLFPTLIPDGLLKRFDRDARVEIAQRRFLPNETQTYIPERDDGGPPIKLFKPFSEIDYVFGDIGHSGKMVMDGLGFCNAPENDYRLPKIQIIAIGDSFTGCYPPAPELTWPSVLGREMAMTAYNLGRGGYGPYEYVQLLKMFGLEKKPDIVVMQIYEGNDLRDAARYHRYVAASEEEKARFPDRAGWEPLSVDHTPLLGNVLSRNSYAYNFVVVGAAYGLSELNNALSGDRKSKVNFRYRLNFAEGGIEMNLDNNDKDEVRTALDLKAGAIGLELFDAALRTYADLARIHGFVPVLAYAPSAHTAYADVVAFEDPGLKELLSWFSQMQRDHLRRLAEALGLVFVDLTPAMQAAGRSLRGSKLLYYPINIHYTPAGQQVAAETVAKALGTN